MKLQRLIVFGILTLVTGIYLFWDLPNPMMLTSNPPSASTKLLDRKGNLIYEIFFDQRRTPISLKTLPAHVINATLAAEDHDFYKHSGFSARGIARAFINTFFRRSLQGGSTITQQLVKNALLTSDRTIRRKIREFTLSIIVEIAYSKDQILEMYLNQVPYGGTAYGIESASKTYFGKSASELNLSESSLLAGLPQAPSYYSPFGSRPEQSKIRQIYVLDQMLSNKFITQAEHDQALETDVKFDISTTLKAPHFSLWVKDLLAEKYGLKKIQEEGLVVTTTLDLDLQIFAQDAVATEVAKLKREKVGNGAALVTQPKTGQILAMVGSKDYFNIKDEGNVNVTLAKRQPGSAIKPITYAIGIDKKLFTAATVLADKPTCFAQANQELYCPVNYDGQWHGPTQVRFALANSFNIPAVKALVITGLSNFVATASAFGFTTLTDPTKYGPSLTLGGGEVTMLDLVTAFGVLANTGQRVNLNPILEVRDRFGQILEKTPSLPANTRVISAGAAYIVSHLLFDNGARSATFGQFSYLVVPKHPEVSVKTGTTNDKRDNWTIGYNPDILVAVWVGNNDNTPMSNVASGVTGASPIWNKIMSFSLKDKAPHWPVQPPDVIGGMVCSLSGLKVPDPAPADCSPRYEYFLKGTFPPVQGDLKKNIDGQDHMVIYDPLGVELCLDCPGGYGETNIIRLDKNGKAY
ncbi:transglycosylase domain-containing protein [Candidatus Amesbacteria bacterium]|nr:transglycosylase domain-containing protein [Candidatus Amesbacteria bacterium]